MASAREKVLALGQDELTRIEKFGPWNEGWQHVIWNDYRYIAPC